MIPSTINKGENMDLEQSELSDLELASEVGHA